MEEELAYCPFCGIALVWENFDGGQLIVNGRYCTSHKLVFRIDADNDYRGFDKKLIWFHQEPLELDNKE